METNDECNKLKELLKSLKISEGDQKAIMEMKASNDKKTLEDTKAIKGLEENLEMMSKDKADLEAQCTELVSSIEKITKDKELLEATQISVEDAEKLIESVTTSMDGEFEKLESEVMGLIESMRPEVNFAEAMKLMESAYRSASATDRENGLLEELNTLKNKVEFDETFKDCSFSQKDRARGLLESVSSPDAFKTQANIIKGSFNSGGNDDSSDSDNNTSVLKYI